ncbi:hypothetical protein V6Z11_A05G329500 [Gossypium hirsutum]
MNEKKCKTTLFYVALRTPLFFKYSCHRSFKYMEKTSKIFQKLSRLTISAANSSINKFTMSLQITSTSYPKNNHPSSFLNSFSDEFFIASLSWQTKSLYSCSSISFKFCLWLSLLATGFAHIGSPKHGRKSSIKPEFIWSKSSLLADLFQDICSPYFFSNLSKTEGPIWISGNCH